MEKKNAFYFIVLMVTAILIFTTNNLSQVLPYLGQTPPSNVPVRLVPDSLAANNDWQYHGTPTFSPDGNEMYYAIYRYNPGRIEIWFTECIDGKWTSVKKAPFSSDNYSNNNPYFSQHKDTLYFLSDRPNGIVFKVTRNNGVWSSPLALNFNIPIGYSPGWQFSIANNGNIYAELTNTKTGGEDIYLWRCVNNQYQPAEKLSAICSPQLDFTPFIDPAERFIMFASRRPGGFGNTDLYISKKNLDNTWAAPINLGKEINSGDIISPLISRDGKYFFFDAWMPNALGGNPYWVDAKVIYDLIIDTTVVTDYDGNSYKTVKIGNQIWMAENLRSTHYSDGTPIPYFDYNNDSANAKVYGRLYSWPDAVKTTQTNNMNLLNVQGISPEGWHLPTKEEWEELFDSNGGANVAGGNLKESGTAHWDSPNTGATNSSGFTAIAGGFRGPDGIFYDLGKHGSYWGTAQSAQEPYCVYMYNTSANVISEVSPIDKTSGITFAIRCIKNDANTDVKDASTKPTGYNLFQNYPNPFNPSTTIKYELKTQSFVKIIITNVLGEIVFDAINEVQAAGVHEYNFNAAHLSSGIYFYQLVAGNYREIKKMVLLR